MKLKLKLKLILAGSTLLFGSMGIVNAASITPGSFSATIGVGETITVEKTVTIAEGDVADKVDFYFLADNTGSMGGVISSVKSVASSLLTSLSGAYTDAAFGVGSYLGDPGESSYDINTAYDVITTSTTNTATAQAGINTWNASGGADFPEANFFALHQAATDGGATDGIGATDTGVGGGESVDWRAATQKVVLWFGDASSHPTSASDTVDTVDQAEAIAALNAAGVTVIGLNTTSAGFGIDTSGQATAVTDATGGALVNNFGSVPLADIVATILDAVDVALGTVDISLFANPALAGLDIFYACTDALGCNNVAGGESRTLDMTVTGLAPGDYSYDTVLSGFPSVVEADRIIVTGASSVPEPSVLLLLSAGLIGFGFTRRRNK